MINKVIFYVPLSTGHYRETKSTACKECFIDPISKFINVELRLLQYSQIEERAANVFIMELPKVLPQKTETNQLIFIPMWDWHGLYKRDFFLEMPKYLKVVSTTKGYSEILKDTPLSFFDLRYFPKPIAKNPLLFDRRVCGYWNRKNAFSPLFLSTLCDDLHLDKLIVRNHPDGLGYGYVRDIKVKNTEVVYIDKEIDKDAYLEIMSECNIFIAPRRYEGIGVTMLEQMAQGKVVLGYDSHTMNEYITHRKNGLLFPLGSERPENVVNITDRELEEMSSRALQYCQNGYQQWVASQENFYHFLIDDWEY